MRKMEERAISQLIAIERVHAIKIQNKEDIARLISEKVNDSRQILEICSSLNLWVVMNKKEGDVTIPHEALESIFELHGVV
jgi:hypothetical protein